MRYKQANKKSSSTELLPGVLAALADVLLVAAYDHWCEGPHQAPVAQLKRPIDLVVDSLGVSELLSLPRGANVAIRDSPFESDTSAVSLE